MWKGLNYVCILHVPEALRRQKKVSDSWNQSCRWWLLGTEPMSSTGALSHGAIFPAPKVYFYLHMMVVHNNGFLYILQCVCGNLNENVPHRLSCLNTWSPVGGTVGVVLGGTALLEEECHWEWPLRLQRLKPSLVCSLPPAHHLRRDFPAAAPTAMPACCSGDELVTDSYASGAISQNKPFLL